MGSLTYGVLTGMDDSTTVTVPVAASQYFYHEGINFVDIDSSGHATKVETADTEIYGFAIVPKGRGVGEDNIHWQSSATAGKDSIQVVTDRDALFLLPADATPAITDNVLLCDLIAANDSNDVAEYVDIGTSSTDVLQIVDYNGAKYGGATNSVVVRINPLKYQAD